MSINNQCRCSLQLLLCVVGFLPAARQNLVQGVWWYLISYVTHGTVIQQQYCCCVLLLEIYQKWCSQQAAFPFPHHPCFFFFEQPFFCHTTSFFFWAAFFKQPSFCHTTNVFFFFEQPSLCHTTNVIFFLSSLPFATPPFFFFLITSINRCLLFLQRFYREAPICCVQTAGLLSLNPPNSPLLRFIFFIFDPRRVQQSSLPSVTHE